MYQLICIAPDGDHVVDSTDHATVEEAGEVGVNLGSKWFFYPIQVVADAAGTIVSAYEPFDFLTGANVADLKSLQRQLTLQWCFMTGEDVPEEYVDRTERMVVMLDVRYDPELVGSPNEWDWRAMTREQVEVVGSVDTTHGICTSDDPTNHQGDTCPIHERG